MNAILRRSVVNTRRTRQDHLYLKEYWSIRWRVHLFEQPGVEVVRACESRNTQQRCSSNEPVYGVGVSVYWLVFIVYCCLLFMVWGVQKRTDSFVEESGCLRVENSGLVVDGLGFTYILSVLSVYGRWLWFIVMVFMVRFEGGESGYMSGKKRSQ